MILTASSVIGIIGNVISILMFASPIKTFWGIVKKKSIENYSEIPYITTLLATCLWTFYGFVKPAILIATVNGAGAVMQCIYLIIFFIYAPKDKKVKIVKLISALNIAFLGSVIALTQHAIIPEKKIAFVGIVCSVLSILMYASPLSAMSMVVKMQSVEYMPFLLSFSLFLNGGIWSIYAVIVRDIYVAVPNGMGFLLGSAQVVLYLTYRKKGKKATEAAATEMEAKHKTCLAKGHSLPQPLVNRVPPKLSKTASLSSAYDLEAAWALVAPGDTKL